ncbi:hypothetical protein DUNSADRAFT_1226 [Dunaliella salina]|uniref:VWFA domain-containing protein n=1 Tax=Dunaliella salina TaxID=3046 RepID=A0ABQ7FXT5_DUNSA|nr:hypothetical protein DUNSADRAFT_1226 [Dunaliella salina]|eukprot:KAF5827164.1 hypothetical protein DUNSADRAFT_1226 [Dunaliella salina]
MEDQPARPQESMEVEEQRLGVKKLELEEEKQEKGKNLEQGASGKGVDNSSTTKRPREEDEQMEGSPTHELSGAAPQGANAAAAANPTLRMPKEQQQRQRRQQQRQRRRQRQRLMQNNGKGSPSSSSSSSDSDSDSDSEGSPAHRRAPGRPDALTENAAPAFASTGNQVLDLFFSLAETNPHFDGSRLSSKVLAAAHVAPQDTLRVIFNARDCRKGKGIRAQAMHSMATFFLRCSQRQHVLQLLLETLPDYGRYRDLFDLVRQIEGLDDPELSHSWRDAVLGAYLGQLQADMAKLQADARATISLAAKWLTSENKPGLAQMYSDLAHRAFPRSPVACARFRKELLAPLRRQLELVESRMSARDFHGVCDNVNGEALKDVLVVSDVSGSMEGTPMEVSIALGILISSFASPPFTNNVITFSEKPTFHELPNARLWDKVQSLKGADWGGNTNLMATFELILSKLGSGEFATKPKTLIILSDMQFDMAVGGRRGETNFEAARSLFKAQGHDMPNVVFWNLRQSNNDAFPVSTDARGVTMLSGPSPVLMDGLLRGEELSPLKILKEMVLESPRYERITYPVYLESRTLIEVLSDTDADMLLDTSIGGLQGVGLQPENLADRLLVKHAQPASKIETNSDKNFENLHES